MLNLLFISATLATGALGFWLGAAATRRQFTERTHLSEVFAAAFENAIDPQYLSHVGGDSEPRVLTWNTKAIAFVGVVPTRGVQKTLAELLSPEVASVARKELCQVAATGQMMRFERCVKSGETQRTLDIVHVPLAITGRSGTTIVSSFRDITSSKQIEGDLRETTALLNATLAHMDQGLLTVDAHGYISVFNARAAELLSLDPAFLESRPHYMDVRRRQMEQGEYDMAPEGFTAWAMSGALLPPERTYERSRPNGQVIEVRCLPLPDGGVVRTYLDVTERKQAEAAIAASEARYRLLAENTTDVIVLSPVSGPSEYISSAIEGLLGYTPDEAVSLSLEALTFSDDRPLVRSAFSAAAAGLPQNVEYRFVHRNGHVAWVEASLRLIPASAGTEPKIIGTIRSIQDRKRVETRLREQNMRFDAALDNMLQGLCMFDADERLVIANRRYTEMFGLPREAASPGTSLEAIQRLRVNAGVYSGDPEAFVAERLAVARAGLPVSGDIQLNDGRVLAHVHHPLPGGGWLATFEDVTERRTNAVELHKAKQAAEAASQAKTDFLATMSHEIRTPLNGILGFADLLLEDTRLAADHRAGLQRIHAAGEVLLTVVNDILDFSKIEAGHLELDERSFEVATLVDTCVSIVGTAADRKGLTLRVDVSSDVPQTLWGDEGRLRQVVLNLLNNAVKFTPSGHVALSVVPMTATGGAVTYRFAVSDTGIGIPEAKQATLFQRFSQVDGSIQRDYGGTGLGLAISKRLVELMGGRIGVLSEPGQGSTFWFEIPLALCDVASPEGLPSASLGTATTRRILVAEDNAINQEIVAAVLRSAGHSVVVVEDGAAAVKAVQSEHFDIVLMDVQMPHMDGLAATGHIRSLGYAAGSLPIIAMTANVMAEQIAQFYASGMDDHVAKPFRREELLSTIQRWGAFAGQARQGAAA